MNYRAIWRSATVLSVLVATVLTIGGTATAQPATAGAVDIAAAQRATTYWTPDRMRSAKPMDALRVSAGPAEVTAGMPTTISPERVSPTDVGTQSFPNSGGTWTGGGSIVRTAGRVFFTIGTQNASCSGNAVVSANKSTVITAGHCVKYQGAWHTNWVFVPAYNNGNAPYGTWSARALKSTPQWVASENISYDIGAAMVNTLNGALLTDVVGAQGVAFNQPKKQNMYAFGYPAAAPYDGTKLIYCSGKAFNEFLGTGDLGLTCNMTGGASGGPWFLQFNVSTGTGLLNSVNSFKYSFSTTWMFGPYFGADAQNLYNAAQSS